MANEKKADQAKPGKKETRQLIENSLLKTLTEMYAGNELPKQLHKKIKKAAKLIAEGLQENKKSNDTALAEEKKKAVKPVKKTAPKKPAVKKVVIKKAAKK